MARKHMHKANARGNVRAQERAGAAADAGLGAGMTVGAAAGVDMGDACETDALAVQAEQSCAADDGDVVELGQVVKLDRGFPLVRLESGATIRCKHATDLVKGCKLRAVIGDAVRVSLPQTHEHGIIGEILPRISSFIRKDPADRTAAQTLAANFDLIIIAQPLAELNIRRLERELVLAHETGVQVAVALTKADLASDEQTVKAVCDDVRKRVGAQVTVIEVSTVEEKGLNALCELVAPDRLAILVGKSGVGKSSLINMMVGENVQETGAVRECDQRGRHTTVSREIIALPTGGAVVDMPGVRGLGMWEAEDGIDVAFSDIRAAADQCKFADCKHENEPGCAVLAAVERGDIAQERLDSYRNLMQETQTMRERKEQARWQKQSHIRRNKR